MSRLLNLDKLPGEVRGRIEPYLKSLLDVHKDNVRSIFIYGSAAGSNFIPGVSDINTAVVLKKIEFGDLKKGLGIISKGIPKKITAPLLLTKEHIDTSLDVFPVEFLNMKESHVVVYGEDILGPVSIDEKNIRFICEQQIKGRLIRIRQGYLEVGLKKKGIEALLKESLASLIPMFRALLRLKGKQPPVDKAGVLAQLCDEFGLRKDVFLPVYRDKSNDEKIESKDVEEYFEKYIADIQKLADAVDRL
ncbi:MAG: hypothetical protein ABH825_01450 [Candidatus Omnitrophota bacterium]